MRGTAKFSPDHAYRYTLTRVWGSEGHPLVLFIMLNPSTADARLNDPTVTRCLGYALKWGYNGLLVGNAYALRSTDPKALRRHPDPVGPANDAELRKLCRRARLVVCAWGAGCDPVRAHEVLNIVRDAGRTPHALALTQANAPRHPLYLRGDLEPVAL